MWKGNATKEILKSNARKRKGGNVKKGNVKKRKCEKRKCE
jgi:hypothetical protein